LRLPRRELSCRFAGVTASQLDGPTGATRGRRTVVVWTVAIISQLTLIGGLIVVAVVLGSRATSAGSTLGQTRGSIEYFVSDSAWRITPLITISRDRWTLDLISTARAGFYRAHPDAEVLIVLSGSAVLQNPRRLRLRGQSPLALSAVRPGSYGQARGVAGLHLQYFRVRASDFWAEQLNSYSYESVLPVIGTASPGSFTTTGTGYNVAVPQTWFPDAAAVRFTGCKLLPTIQIPRQLTQVAQRLGLGEAVAHPLGTASRQARHWYGTVCPPTSPDVSLALTPQEHIVSSTRPPSASVFGSLVASWPGSNGADVPFTVEISDDSVVQSSQRDLLISGVLYGLAGGLVATWLTMGTAAIVKRLVSDRDGAEHTSDGEH
jgi:hypothetical protein